MRSQKTRESKQAEAKPLEFETAQRPDIKDEMKQIEAQGQELECPPGCPNCCRNNICEGCGLHGPQIWARKDKIAKETGKWPGAR